MSERLVPAEEPGAGAVVKSCPACGHAAPSPRIDWHFLAHEVEHSLLHMDRGLLYTMRELMLRPGRMLRDYLAGDRSGHVKPLLLLTVIAATVILSLRAVRMLYPDVPGLTLVPPPGPSADGGLMAYHAVVGAWIERHYTLATLLLLPLEAGCARWVFGRRAGLNYPEWLVVMAFVTAQAFLLQWIAIVLSAMWPAQYRALSAVATLLVVVYGCATLASLFPSWRRRTAWFRAIATFVLFASISALLQAGVAVGLQAHARAADAGSSTRPGVTAARLPPAGT